jgi:hypothetical protein
MDPVATSARRISLAIMPARCKTGIVASKVGTLAHYSGKFEAYFQDGKVRFVADYLCGNQNPDVVVLASADAHYGMCEVCEDAAKGPCVYRCFDTAGDLLYIGSAKAYLRRMQSHVTQSEWWPEVANTKVQRFPTLLEARVAELHAITAENPRHNRQRPGRNIARRIA